MSEEDLSGTVPIRLKVTIEFDNDDEARTVGEALKVDDDEFITTKIEGNVITAHVEANSMNSARRAADDWMACLMSIKNNTN